MKCPKCGFKGILPDFNRKWRGGNVPSRREGNREMCGYFWDTLDVWCPQCGCYLNEEWKKNSREVEIKNETKG